jgi:uncharacterized lipoprotein YajG
MKNLFALFLAAGILLFASCDNTASTTEDTTTTEVNDQAADAIVIDNDTTSGLVDTTSHEGHAH